MNDDMTRSKVRTERLGYQPSFDGIRAIAISLVVASHAHPTALKGGSLGVDAFFALSGFLITTLILEEMNHKGERQGDFGFRNFYVRRALRLFPALYACILIVSVYLVVRRDHLDYFIRAIGVNGGYSWATWVKFIVGAATYTTNLIGVTMTPGNPFGHTWSLALEEQFYLIWPVLLVMSYRRHKSRSLLMFVGFLVAVTLVIRLVGVNNDDGFLFQRPEVIAAGVVAALLRWEYVPLNAMVESASRILVTVGTVGVVLLAVAKGRFVSNEIFDRGLITVVGMMCALTVWAFTFVDSDFFLRRLLELRPVVYLGTISYGLYIWHIPIFRFFTFEFPGMSGALNISLKVSVSMLIAALSARFIERPFRMKQRQYRS